MHLSLELIGNVGNDATINQVSGYNAISFNVAHTEKFKNSDGQSVERTTWVNCTIWIKQGVSTEIAKYLKKGQLVRVEGLPSVDTYTNKDQKTIAQLRLRVDKIKLLGGQKTNNGSGTTTPIAQAEQPAPIIAGDAPEEDLPF